MQVFKAFCKLAWSYKIAICIYFGICAFMTFMVASQYSDTKKEEKYGNESYHITVADEDKSALSKAFIGFLKKQHTVEETAYEPELVKDLLYYQEMSAYITIPKGFEEKHRDSEPLKVESLSDKGQAAGVFINMQLSSYLEGVARMEKTGLSLEEAIKETEETNDFSKFVKLEGKENTSSNTHSKFYSLLLFLPYAVMTIILSTVLPVILIFSQKDIKDRTDISAVSNVTKNIALVAGGALVSFIVFLALFAFTSLFLTDDLFTGKWLLAALNLFIFTIVTTTLLILISAFSFLGIQKAKDVITNIIGLGFSFLGGIFVPLSILGDGVKAVGKFLPTYWYAVSLEQIDKGVRFSGLLKNFSMELLFGVVCLALGIAISSARKNAMS